MEDNERREKEAIDHLKNVEIRFHIVKMVFIVVVAAIVALYVVTTVKHDNDRTRSYIHCVVTNITARGRINSSDAINKCGAQ